VTPKLRALVVDDEPAILRFLQAALGASDYVVSSAATVQEALKGMGDNPDIVILDLGLPDGDGKDVIREIRRSSNVPIVVLSARDREAEKIEALDLGADDFVNKPFGVGELMARLRAALRHRHEEAETIRAGALEIDIAGHRVTRAGADIKLTRREFDLLACLARQPGKVITHRKLLTAVWGPAQADETQYLRVYIGHLRQKLEDDPDDPKIIETELGIGYRLVEN
jgi:two-component system KDP operon response regulator KdpE